MLRAARWKYSTQKSPQNSPSGHHRATLSGYIFANKACIDNRNKLVKQQYLLQRARCPHNMVNFGPVTAEIGSGVLGTPANFNGFRVLASLLHRRRSTEVNKTLQDVWPSPGLVHNIYILGTLPPNGILPAAKVCVQVLRSPMLAALLHRTRAAATSQTLRRGTRNEITELSQTAPPIFGWAAITLGIGPHF